MEHNQQFKNVILAFLAFNMVGHDVDRKGSGRERKGRDQEGTQAGT